MRERDFSACTRRHQAVAQAPVEAGVWDAGRGDGVGCGGRGMGLKGEGEFAGGRQHPSLLLWCEAKRVAEGGR